MGRPENPYWTHGNMETAFCKITNVQLGRERLETGSVEMEKASCFIQRNSQVKGH